MNGFQVNDKEFTAGYEAAALAYDQDEPVGDPVGVHEDYRLGWWCAVGDTAAFLEGWDAYERGVMSCPYSVGADDECFREHWFSGYTTAMRLDDKTMTEVA